MIAAQLLLALALLVSVFGQMPNKEGYQVWRLGNPKNVDVPSEGGVALIGGGADCDDAFKWMTSHTNGGDFVVLRASGDDAYNPYVMKMSIEAGVRINSVTTILFTLPLGANAPEVAEILENADGIFFAGGDQSNYIKWWTGTPVQSIIQKKVLNNVTIGGTSAGLAILGNYIFGCMTHETINSPLAMANPYDYKITLVPGFLQIPFLETIFTDSHFVTRDRMGRLLTFLAREVTDGTGPLPIRGLGVDESTALLLDINTGIATTVGTSYAFVCSPQAAPEICKKKTPLTYKDIPCLRLNGTANTVYDFNTFTGDSTAVTFVNSISNGVFLTDPFDGIDPGSDDYGS